MLNCTCRGTIFKTRDNTWHTCIFNDSNAKHNLYYCRTGNKSIPVVGVGLYGVKVIGLIWDIVPTMSTAA